MPPRGYHKPARERRAKQFTFWLTAAEKEQIRDAARRAGLTPSAYVRTLALGGRPRPKPGEEVRELIRQLSRIGNNLNQLHGVAEAAARAQLPAIEQARQVVRRSLRDYATNGTGRAIEPDQLADLIHHGATLNALTYSANAGRFPPAAKLRNALADIADALKALAR
jgi:hypothetical protein